MNGKYNNVTNAKQDSHTILEIKSIKSRSKYNRCDIKISIKTNDATIHASSSNQAHVVEAVSRSQVRQERTMCQSACNCRIFGCN